MNKNKFKGGSITIEILVFTGIFAILASGFILWSLSMLNWSLRGFHNAQAFDIAEAGIEYYRWHLAHAPTDYQDGTGQPGPYTHNYYDRNGNLLGQFILDITPPPSGSTVVTVQSTGLVGADATIQKIIVAKFAIASFAQYAIAANDFLRFGPGTEVFGPIMSNGGIHFDGLAHNLVSSAQTTTTDPDYNRTVWGVYTMLSPQDPYPPTPLPSRPDVFMSGRQIGVPALDFTGMTQNLSTLQSLASSSGVYVTSSRAYGFDLVLNTTSSYAIYKVTALTSPPRYCSNPGQSGWGTWSIQSESLYKTGPIPTNGIFFFNDNLWVRGQINNSRVTIASGVFPDNPTTRTSITVNQNLQYTNFNGQDVISLIAQNNINVGLVSNDNLTIDGALIAQNGRIGRYYYSSACGSNYIRSTITSYGMLGSNQRYGFAYTDGTGYQTRNLIYDGNLLYGPPPSFPLTSGQYNQISWQEIK